MKRIYLDRNIYNFQKHEIPLYVELYDKLRNNGNNLLNFFSHAHLLDLKRDKSNRKFEDLAFMEQFVDSNYLVLQWGEENVIVKEVTPLVAFQHLQEDDIPLAEYFDFDKLFNFDDDDLFDDSDEMKEAKRKLDEALNTPMGIGNLSSFDNIADKEKRDLGKLLPLVTDLSNDLTLKGILGIFTKTYDNLLDDSTKTYKNLRRFSIEKLKLKTKFNIDITSINFNEDLKNTPLQVSFFELVNKSIEINNKQDSYNYFITAYNLLNILGIDNESNQKAQFVNTFNDSQHGFYAAHCDYLISDDEGLRLKCKVLYKLLDIETKVLSVSEFIQQFEDIVSNPCQDLQSFFNLLASDLKNPINPEIKESSKFNRVTMIVKLTHSYFGYFNCLDYINDENEGQIIVLRREIKNFSKFAAFKEYATVINKIVEMFGIDANSRGNYDMNDREEMEKGHWNGRIWGGDNMLFLLEINEGVGFCFSYFLDLDKVVQNQNN